MSNRPNGNRTVVCPICGTRYTRSNFNVRRGVRGRDGKLLADTHQIACEKRRAEIAAKDAEIAKLRKAVNGILTWYDSDGSVGGLCDPIEELRDAIVRSN